MSDSVQPHRRQPNRFPRPWDSPSKNTGVGCHFLLQCMKVKSLSRVRLLVTPWTAAYQAPPSMGFSRQSVKIVFKKIMPYNGIILSHQYEVLIHNSIWMNLKNAILSKRSQTQNDSTYIKYPD